jgi:hypothetical protein
MPLPKAAPQYGFHKKHHKYEIAWRHENRTLNAAPA